MSYESGAWKRPTRPLKPQDPSKDYLAAVYDLASTGSPVIGARLAKHMGISPPAVTEAVQRMARSGYLNVGPSKALSLE